MSLFRQAMSRVPSPVVVVTASRGPTMHGMTVGSFTSVSLEPPIVSFAVKPPSRTLDMLAGPPGTARFAAHVLGKHQVRLSIDFSTQRTDGASPFRPGAYYIDANDGLPILLGALVVLRGTVEAVHEVGDHHLCLGKVTDIDLGPPSAPLLYYSRKYHSVGDEAFMASFEDSSLQAQLWTHEGHLRMAWNYLRTHDHATALRFIREGLQRFNERNTHLVRRPYNETVTQFFVHMILRAPVLSEAQALQQQPDTGDFYAWLAQHPELANPSVVLEYYSKALLYSDRALVEFVPPDLQPLPPRA